MLPIGQGYAPPIESLSSHVLSGVHSAVHCAMHCAVHCTVLSAVQLQRRKGRKIFGEGKSDDGRTDRLTDRISSCRLLSRDHSVEGIQWKVMLEVHNIYRQVTDTFTYFLFLRNGNPCCQILHLLIQRDWGKENNLAEGISPLCGRNRLILLTCPASLTVRISWGTK